VPKMDSAQLSGSIVGRAITSTMNWELVKKKAAELNGGKANRNV
jgi:hypothetical protein